MADHEFPPYVNIPPIAKTRSTSHLAPTPEHHRSVSYEETTTASTSTDSVPGVRIRSESSQVSQDFPSPAPRMYVAAYEYVAQREDELDLPAGSIVKLVSDETNEDGWYRGELGGKVGMFPSNYARIHLPTNKLLEFKASEILLPDKNKHIDDFRIGHGATATVFKVDIDTTKRNLNCGRLADTLPKDQRKAALKRFNRYGYNRGDVPADVGQLEQLKREANLVNGLSHQNIVRLLGICLEDPYFGLLLELCEGSSLRAVCRGMYSAESIPLGVLIGWAGQIADGMEYLISQGYVHRDLKADNVLVKEEVCLCHDEETMKFDWCSKCGRRPLGKLQLKITDFGGSRKMTADANRFSTAGTYAWLAPEAFRDGAWSESSDVWSFGVVLWELLSREEPYQGQMPTAIAFLIAMKGQNLAINDDCPEKWKNIMQHCWALEPKDRPTFSYLVKYFKDYAKELEDQNKQIQRAPSMMAVKEIYTHRVKDMEKMFHDLYSGAGGDINRKNRRSIAPETKARKNKNHKGKKLEISGPQGDVKHIVSVQKASDTNFKIKYNEFSPGGTLPRLSGRQSTLSISSPDLFASLAQVNGEFGTVGHGTTSRISRKPAIRKKKTNPNMYESPVVSPTYDESSLFAKIENADEEASVSTKEHKNTTLSKVWSKLHPWRNHKRDSKEDEDKAGSISSRSSSTTSSNRIIAGPASRSAVATSFLDAGAGARTRAQSAADCWDETGVSRKNKVSPSDKRPVKVTNLTERFTKEPEVPRPSILPPHHRKSALDQTIPASPNSPDSGLNTSFPPMGVHSRRTTAGSSCDGALSYESLVNTASGSSQGMGHGHKSHVKQPGLSDYVPIAAEEQTHYLMKDGGIFGSNGHAHEGHGHGKTTYYPVGGGCDDYIQVGLSGMKPTVGEVSNSPYSERSIQVSNSPYSDRAAHFYSRNVQNPQYVHCRTQQKKLPTPPIKIQSESNLVATGRLAAGSGASANRPNHLIGNSASSFSLNEPPDILAPLPPRVSMSPPNGLAPVLPPRDGSLSPAPRTMLMNQEVLKKPDPVVF